MYPQNTTPEDDDDGDIGAIPLGFPGMGDGYHASTRPAGNDTGDIVGSDGHVEELPPYSRYADNVIAKGDMARINAPASGEVAAPDAELPLSPASEPALGESDVQLNTAAAREAQEEVGRRERWRKRTKGKQYCALPLWMILLLTAAVICSTILGGVVGGLIGNRKAKTVAM